MKKILIALLAVLLCFSLMACDNTPEETTPEDIGGETTPEDIGGETTPNEGDETTKPDETTPEETETEEVLDTDTLAVGEDSNNEFSPVKQ